jgi:hypothetical protein
MTKLTVRLVKSDFLNRTIQQDEYDSEIVINDVGYGYDTFHSKIERDSHCESVIKGIVGLAEALNLSFRQEGEYIYLEGK